MADVKKDFRSDCKMEVFLPRLIPSPPDRKTFIRDSHFQFAYDREDNTVVSPFQIDYPPRWGRYQREPIRPPKSADVLNQDMDNSWDTRSETLLAYPAWPLQPRPEMILPTGYFQPHADPHQQVLTSVTHESYPCPTVIQRNKPSHVDKWVDSCPSGDKEKIPLPSSQYHHSYQFYKDIPLAIKAPCQHLGDDSVLKGDDYTRRNTLYRSQFTAEWGPPAECFPKAVTSIVFGDPRYHQVESEHKHTYTVQQSDGCRYDPEVAAATVFKTNIQPGDGCHRFSTIMSKFFPWFDPGTKLVSSYQQMNASSILRGDLKDGVGITNHQFYYKEPKNLDPPVLDHPARGPAKICLGDNRWVFFNTTHHAEFQTPSEIYKVDSKENPLKTNFAFNYPAFPLRTSTQDMLLPHQQPMHRISEEDKKKIKYSHLVHPWKDLRWLCTEQKDKYTNKYSGPITLGIMDFQHSSIPLGTMRNYKTRQKMVS